ncbi:alpha/beta fold hydrolase [Amycolatopsis mediterranei]|uniref:alpha/beta fold hydrolase n=1 Tax=Amycolatopsis mediterranei TaxID=33910 RepID=UPI00038DC65D|nr:alpha/beta fold hydrolase [Amycolatopsis mediterranei]AGT87815.1 3-oxoadipate enol-lactonase [Amycolatopsis mediterranei RB]
MTDLHWIATGRADGPVVLLSNPLGATSDVWADLAGVLEPRFRVIRYDSRGHGLSPLGKSPIDIGSLVDDAADVLDSASAEHAHVVGLSLGGMVGMSLAARMPTRVRSLTAMCTAAFFPDKEIWGERARAARDGRMADLADSSLERWFTSAWTHRHPAAVQAARRMFLSTSVEGYARTAEAVGALDLRDALPLVVCPALVVAGRFDPSTPSPLLQEIADGIDQSRYRELEGAHWLPVEAAAAVSETVLSFLAEVDQSVNRGAEDAKCKTL